MVAAITGQNRPPSGLERNCMTRETSPSPSPIAQSPMTIMINSPVSSTQVRTTLAFTLSPTPRKLIAATAAMNTSPTIVMPTVV